MAADQLSLDGAEERVRQILESRRKANASGQRGEDADNIRAAYDAEMAAPDGVSGSLSCEQEKKRG